MAAANVPTLGFTSLVGGTLVVLLPVAAVVTAATMRRAADDGDYRGVDPWRIAAIAAVKLLHYLAGGFMAFYLFVFDRRFDVAFVWFYTIVVLHWAVLGECVLSYLERRTLDPAYRIGQQPHAMINRQLGMLPMLVVRLASVATLFVVAVRTVYPSNPGLAVLVILLSVLLESGNAWARARVILFGP